MNQILETLGIVITALLAGILLAYAVKVTAARAHSDGGMTYPPECCHSLDCAPVDKTEVLRGSFSASIIPLSQEQIGPGLLLVTTRHGSAIVPPDMPRRESKDARAHACIRAGKLVCYFLPPSM